MTRLGFYPILVSLSLGLAVIPAHGAEAGDKAADFKEVYDLVREHLAGANDAELNRAAVKGLVSALGPRVSLVSGDEKGAAPTEKASVSRTAVFDNGLAYLRVGSIESGIAAAVREAWRRLEKTNELRGLVLDLRYAGGEDYAAAAGTAELFLKKERPLLNWGQGVVQSRPRSDAITQPVVVLINRQTAGAAEALAAVLRETGAGLLLGNRTAGQAMVTSEFSLKNGDRLRIATAPVQLGDGSPLSTQGVAPDVTVEVGPEDERAFFADPLRAVSRTGVGGGAVAAAGPGANRALRRPRYNEAELVRERREGTNYEAEVAPARLSGADKDLVQDPVLARALDVLKGLAVVRQSRS